MSGQTITVAGILRRFSPWRKRIERMGERIAQIEARQAEAVQAEAAPPDGQWVTYDTVRQMIQDSILVPSLDGPTLSDDAPFMAHSTCSASDFQHPRYYQLCRVMSSYPVWHRKQWEWIFILHHLMESGVLKDGSRGIGFGVGQEPLPAAFALAGASVIATDAPPELVSAAGWVDSTQHSRSLNELRMPWIPDDLFDRRVSFRSADMKAIDPTLTGFDFTWSSCCFEHLGTLRAGLDFVRESVETCLKPGGVAVHTTEFNLSSNSATLEEDPFTVIYRRSDMEAFADEMRQRGHEVQPFRVGPSAHSLDNFVDIPPYAPNQAHLRLRYAGHSCTSAGLVIRRGQ